MNQGKTYYYGKAVEYVTYYIAITFTRSFTHDPSAIILYLLILFCAIRFSNRRYFPFFSKLVISDSCVLRICFGKVMSSLNTNRVYTAQLKIYKTSFVVFLGEPIENVTIANVAKLLKYRLAIIYPYLPAMKLDYPQLFERFN